MANDNGHSTGMSISDVADSTGLSVHTLRFYERQELLVTPVRRTSGGRRVYHREDVEWLHICTRLRASGMPLATLRDYVSLVREGPGNEEKRLALLREHRSHVETRLAELQACLDLITWKVGVYEQHVNDGTARGVWDPGVSENTPTSDSPA